MSKILHSILVLTILLIASGATQAALIDRGGGFIYDDVLDITWLQDTNYGAGSAFDDGTSNTDGRMTWLSAVAWADSLSVFDSVRNVTYDDWRLPTVSPINGVSFDVVWYDPGATDGTTDRGYADSAGWVDGSGNPVSEMGHMYYVNLANLGYCDPSLPWCTQQAGWGLNNTGSFTNTQYWGYWFGTDFSLPEAWYFDLQGGYQSPNAKDTDLYAWAVRSGDVSVVPVPAAVWLFGSALGLLGWMRRTVS